MKLPSKHGEEKLCEEVLNMESILSNVRKKGSKIECFGASVLGVYTMYACIPFHNQVVRGWQFQKMHLSFCCEKVAMENVLFFLSI